jgi:hypothetical protein
MTRHEVPKADSEENELVILSIPWVIRVSWCDMTPNVLPTTKFELIA